MRLNPDDTPDRKIAALLKEIPDLTHESKRPELLRALEKLTVESQQMIKDEWEKVKAESKDGDISKKKPPNKSSKKDAQKTRASS